MAGVLCQIAIGFNQLYDDANAILSITPNTVGGGTLLFNQQGTATEQTLIIQTGGGSLEMLAQFAAFNGNYRWGRRRSDGLVMGGDYEVFMRASSRWAWKTADATEIGAVSDVGVLEFDDIDPLTAGHGVTVDGVNLEDFAAFASR